MSLKIQDSAATRTIRRLSIMDTGLVLRPLQQLGINDATNTPRPVFAGLLVDVSPTFISGGDTSESPVTITTTTVTATPSGGIAPYTYLWTITDPSTPNWSVDFPTTATTSASCSFVVPGGFETANIHCTVTDSIGTTAVSEDVGCGVSNLG